MDKLTVRDADVAGKRVFVRVDFNVPIADGKVQDDSRIRAAIPTIGALVQAGAKLVLASHLGRPNGKVTDSLRLRPVGQRLTELIQQDIQELHRLGYAQQLFREMGGFSNFAISFSIRNPA